MNESSPDRPDHALILGAVLALACSTLQASPQAPRLGALWIVDADSNITWDRLPFDDLIDLNHAPAALNIIVDAAEPVGSVVFTLDGVPVKTENAAPYAMGGDTNGDFHTLNLPEGFHIIEATGYTGPNGTGSAGPASIVTLEVGRSDFDVNTTTDSPDANPGDGQCRSRTNQCSLRAAIEEANALNGRQWVHLPAGNYALTQGSVSVTDRVTVRGELAELVSIDGNGERAFHIESLRSDFDEITISGAHGQNGGGAYFVAKGAQLKLLDVHLTGNTANGGPGAGLRNDGTTTILRSRVTDNDNSFEGLCGGGVTASGGGLANYGTLRMYRSSVSGNRAIRGGGLFNQGLAVISNTTFSANLARAGGGAILNKASLGETDALHLAFSTLTENEANVPCRSGLGGDPENQQVGGGIYNTGNATIGSSIIAQNVDHREDYQEHYAPDCWSGNGTSSSVLAKLASAGRNVWGELNNNCGLRYPNGLAFDDCKPAQAGPGGCFVQPGDQILLDKWGIPAAPLDAELASLSGSPPAHSLSATSPAIDFGGSLPLEFVFLACPETDQWQRLRPFSGDGICDAGARER